jgi:hypothetical protein
MLHADLVKNVFLDCMFRDEEVVDGVPIAEPVKVEGVVNNFGFHPTRLESHKEEIKSLLAELPKEFHQHTGGGMSFLNACVDKDGNQWGEHRSIEQLMCLGIGVGAVMYCMPKEVWSVLPGGMPYFMVKG